RKLHYPPFGWWTCNVGRHRLPDEQTGRDSTALRLQLDQLGDVIRQDHCRAFHMLSISYAHRLHHPAPGLAYQPPIFHHYLPPNHRRHWQPPPPPAVERRDVISAVQLVGVQDPFALQ